MSNRQVLVQNLMEIMAWLNQSKDYVSNLIQGQGLDFIEELIQWNINLYAIFIVVGIFLMFYSYKEKLGIVSEEIIGILSMIRVWIMSAVGFFLFLFGFLGLIKLISAPKVFVAEKILEMVLK